LGMLTRNRIRVSERQAAALWQGLAGKVVISAEDEPLGVVYPGRSSGDSGPDFRDAVIASQFRLTKGDVEVHVKSSDWYGHEHHANAAYNNVVLHVVVWHDCHSPTLLQSGRRIPVLCLAEALRCQPYLLPHRLACFQILRRLDRQALEKLLDSAGEERFMEKAARFRNEILRTGLTEPGSGQALFRGIMRALGYAKNTRPFEDLADRLPLDCIESTAGLIPKQALLLGAAGLLPSQRRLRRPIRSKEVQELERTWRSATRHIEAMSENDWTFSHIYPNNSPVRRIVALSYLLERYQETKLTAGILQLVRQAPASNGRQALEKGLVVAAQSYWRNHLDFGARSKAEIPTVLGNSKADEIAVNVALPFAYSWGTAFNEPGLVVKARGLYHNYPGLADNGITRHMMRQLGADELAGSTARRQQGLIHIFRNYCREGRCGECPLAGQMGPRPSDKLPQTS
jgi:hypothetical protein